MQNLTTAVRNALSEAGSVGFRPHLFEDTRDNSLTCLTEDSSITEEQEPGSSIVILRNTHSDKVVGVRIENVSMFGRIKD